MAQDDPKLDPTDETAVTGAKDKSRRRPPPTLDLPATDVTPPAREAAQASEAADTLAPAAESDVSEGLASESISPEPAASEAAAAGSAAQSPATEDATPPEPVHPSEVPGPKPEAVAPATTRRPGVFASLLIALVSGLIGGAVAFAVVSTFYNAGENVEAITDLEARALDLRQRIDVLEASTGGANPLPAGALAPQELATRLDALESGLTAIGGKVNEMASAPPAATPAPGASAEEVSGLGTRVGTLDTRLGALESHVAALPAPVPAVSPEELAAARTRIGALEQQVATVSAQQRASGQAAAQLAALGALKEAVVAGRPFVTELKASRALLGAGGDTLAALEPRAATGFPAGPALLAQLKAAIAPKAEPAAPDAAPNAEASIVDRLMKSAGNLVTVRRSTEAPSEAATSGLATAEAALARDDLSVALAALNGLPADARALAAPVISDIEARQAALAAVAGLSQHVLATLAGGVQ
ncbi:COG4223 family protein [Ancylobacter amanitiformis]|uniref:Mitochondrial inner membrane protein n=1 Tax=Ancylobacter amanitiformis TaxID=217069 RepID=A0ABU0LP78_9HYPH|nr:hypothetical protein [Ancylobacter amanitiformis]MDQ0510450.1 hypothetical protein [Ancylobacter amanitiformis]